MCGHRAGACCRRRCDRTRWERNCIRLLRPANLSRTGCSGTQAAPAGHGPGLQSPGARLGTPFRMKRRTHLSLLAITAEGLLSRLSFGVIGFALPLYARHVGLSFTQIGIFVCLYISGALVFNAMLL